MLAPYFAPAKMFTPSLVSEQTLSLGSSSWCQIQLPVKSKMADSHHSNKPRAIGIGLSQLRHAWFGPTFVVSCIWSSTNKSCDPNWNRKKIQDNDHLEFSFAISRTVLNQVWFLDRHGKYRGYFDGPRRHFEKNTNRTGTVYLGF